jgi:YD repeat-containing protein
MVAIFTGAGTGFERGSGSVLGSAGLLGSASLGRGGDQVFLNAATGNLMISDQDEFLVGMGPDVAMVRTYNSLGDLSDDNGDNWRFGADRRVYGLTGTANSAGSSVHRVSADGSDIVYTWDAARSTYVTSAGAGAYDTLTYNGTTWTWTDGDSRVKETYSGFGANNWVISTQVDTDGNTISFGHVNGTSLIDRVTTADGGYIQYHWSGNNLSDIQTGYIDLPTGASKTLTRTRYTYDASNRLSTVTVDLNPEDNSIADGKTYTTSYTYVGTSKLISSISQSDGSRIDITYDGSNRVATIAQTVTSGVTRTSSLSYGAGYTTITDPLGQVTRLDYDTSNQLTKITLPAATSGAAQQVTQFNYANGDVTSVTDALGNATTYVYDSNGNWTSKTDPLGNVTTRTYGSKNELLSESRWDFGNPTTVASASFESPSLGSGYQYTPTVSGMTFYGGAGIAGNGSAWGFASAPDGSQVGFVQGQGWFSQALTGLTIGTQYAVKFKMAARPSTGGDPVTVGLNGATIGSFTGSTAFQEAVAYFTATGTTATLTFAGNAPFDVSTAIDNITVLAGQPAVTHFAYDSENHLRFSVSPEGDVTEYRYTAAGLVRSTIDYAGAKYTGTAFDLTSLSKWAAGLDPTVQVKRTETQYDPRGDLTTVTEFADLYSNRLYNPEFAGTSGWTIGYNPNGIVASGSPYVGNAQGTSFVKEDINATAAGQMASISSDWSHFVDVYPGESLFASVGVQTSGTANEAHLYVHYYDANGNYLGNSFVGWLSGAVAAGSKLSGYATVVGLPKSQRLSLRSSFFEP